MNGKMENKKIGFREVKDMRIKNNVKIFAKHKTILSPGVHIDMGTLKKKRNCNVLYLGTNAVAKKDFIILNLMQRTGSYVVTDFDGKIQKETEQTFRDNGYDIKVLDLLHFDRGNHYNPFYYMDAEDDVFTLVGAFEATAPSYTESSLNKIRHFSFVFSSFFCQFIYCILHKFRISFSTLCIF